MKKPSLRRNHHWRESTGHTGFFQRREVSFVSKHPFLNNKIQYPTHCPYINEQLKKEGNQMNLIAEEEHEENNIQNRTKTKLNFNHNQN